tara:strand:- start:6443 stop:8143 length:1701 start_codon:yes stop_codon:yes gene_type:complete
MSSYWKVDDTQRIGQTFISIPSENGLSYSAGQKVQLFVGPDTKYMDGHNSYLEFNVRIQAPTGSVPTRLQLDEMGASCLIKNLRIYDGTRAHLLEELESYSSLCSVRYDYDSDTSIRNQRALREGASVHTPANRGTLGTSQTAMANTLTNPYFAPIKGDQTEDFDNTKFLTAKVCIPLHTGIFAQNEHIFPVAMTSGLYLEADLAPASEVIKQLDSVLRLRRTGLNPVLKDTIAASATITSFTVTKDNNLGGDDCVSKFPFVVGETFNFCKRTTTATLATLDAVATITALTETGGEVVVTCNSITNNGASAIDSTYVMYSTAVESSATAYEPTYTVSNVNLVVSQVMLDPSYERGMLQKVREGKAIELDILTATNYKNSILASDRQTTFQVFSQNSRAKSLLIIPQDSTVYTGVEAITGKDTYEILKNTDTEDTVLHSNRSGYTGICDELKDIQYQIGGRLVPSRPIDVSKIASRKSIDSFHLYELEKCLDNAGIVPRSFKAYQSNFVFGRGFGVNQGCLDLRGKDLAVILKYTGTGVPSRPKLFNSFIVHIRKLMITDGGVSVVL